MLAWTVLVLALCVASGQAYNMYRGKIPNGDHVPHPCKPNYLWHGVGHKNSKGGGPRNPFGEDFAASGRVWNEALCRMDSDGDGRTNGQELGDPDCVWIEGQIPPRTSNITHPGVCDPWNAVECVGRNSWLDCTRDESFNCPPINDPDVLNITLRFPPTKVPAQETTYICFNFELPDDREYHLIATKPFIDNRNVMHHIVVTGCDNTVSLVDKPYECIMGSPGCSKTMGLWTLGQTGECINPMAGFLIGKGHTSMVSMQLHWTNPTLVDEWLDSSGLIFYYTPKLRRFNAGVFSIGQQYLNIPPGQNSWVHQGTCTGACSRKLLRGDIQVFSSLHHMHYLGIRQNTTLTRPGRQSEVIADDNPYSYDTPKTHVFDPPITIHPGDELKTYCTFQSRSRSKTTMFGAGSFEEMCFSLLYFFPRENLGDNAFCGQWKDTDFCDIGEKCDFKIVNSTDPSTAAVITKVLDHCDPMGRQCRPECPAVIADITASNKCVRNVWDYVRHLIYESLEDPVLLKFVTAMESCAADGGTVTPRPTWPVETTEKPCEHTETKPEGPGSMFLNLVKAVDARPLLQNIIMNVNYDNHGAKNHDHDDSWH